MGDIFGKGGSDAGETAAGFETAANQQAIEEIRRQFDVTRGDILPFLEAGQRQIPALEQRATPGGLDQILGQIFNTDIFGSLVEERGRAVEGQLAAGGLTRSGTALAEAARVPTDIGLQIEQLLTGRSQALAGGGQSAASSLGQFGSQSAGGIANLLSQSGQSQASGLLADEQADAAGSQNFLNTAATVASIFFSDPSLKENIEEIADMGELKLYQWDWINAVKGTMIEKYSTIGFMADEVKEKFPQFVYNFCGFMVIDYGSLLKKLEA